MTKWTLGIAAALQICIPSSEALAQITTAGFDKTLRSRGPTGAPCLVPKSMTRANTIVSNSYEHLVQVENSCSRAITIRICYKGTESCKQVAISGYGTETVLLGEMLGVPRFDFEYQERAQR